MYIKYRQEKKRGLKQKESKNSSLELAVLCVSVRVYIEPCTWTHSFQPPVGPAAKTHRDTTPGSHQTLAIFMQPCCHNGGQKHRAHGELS